VVVSFGGDESHQVLDIGGVLLLLQSEAPAVADVGKGLGALEEVELGTEDAVGALHRLGLTEGHGGRRRRSVGTNVEENLGNDGVLYRENGRGSEVVFGGEDAGELRRGQGLGAGEVVLEIYGDGEGGRDGEGERDIEEVGGADGLKRRRKEEERRRGGEEERRRGGEEREKG